MIRESEFLHAQRTPAPLRAAATVLLLRDTPDGLAVLMTRRSHQASFAPGAYVFPGGKVDAADTAAIGIAARRPGQSETQLTQSIAAVRECFEELGILLARYADGRHIDAATVPELDRHNPLFDQCRSRGLTLAADGVFTFAHWTTDRDLPRRFDVPFLVARAPQGQEAEADNAEQFEPVWIRPADALQRHAQGSFKMIFPTVRTLERLAGFASADDVFAACLGEDGTERPLWSSCPRAGLRAGVVERFMEHEAPFGELAMVCPDGQPVHALDWGHDRVVPLSRGIARLTAPNPGPKTGPGTNTYLVGNAATGFVVIDPGPDDPAHVQRLVEATGGDVRAIVCTHSHPDHAPAARPLQRLCTERGLQPPPILGLPFAGTAQPSAVFMPDRALRDGEHITLGVGEHGYALEVVFTPGHAANHLCLVLAADRVLFSGDHILNGSTTVVVPPDGNMDAYMHSLDVLESVSRRLGLAFILPAHGHVLWDPPGSIQRLRLHRLAREARVAAAMKELPQGDLDDWVRLAYADVSPALWPLARMSLLAHVERLRGTHHSPAREGAVPA
ncbi:MAG: MBL fold metallo-hydrolase [Pseudomonadota bacterium]